MPPSAPSPQAALAGLFSQLFDGDGLRHFLFGIWPAELSAPVLADLPGAIASESAVVSEAVGALERNRLVDVSLFRALLAEAPGRAEAIRQVSELWCPGALGETAVSLAVAAPRHNLPRTRDRFFGREMELSHLRERIDVGEALITVVGVAGSGKTRLALELGRGSREAWPGGVWFADLSLAVSAEQVAAAVARDLGIVLGRDPPVAAVGLGLAARGKALVLLDHFEQAVAVANQTLGLWFDQAPEVVFLVTSRAVLNLSGESIFPLEPLLPGDDAVNLFVDRARAQRPGFTVSPQIRADIEALVGVLDGLPLALELAAARIRTLTPAQILARIQDRFQLLVSARGPSSLRAAFDASWDLLDPWEKAAFAQVSVFSGTWLLPAAEAVLDLCAWPEAPAELDVVQSLVDKSLLRTWVPQNPVGLEADEPCFGMFVSIQAYAAEKLRELGAVEPAELRHGQWYARMGEASELLALEGPEAPLRRARLGLALENLERASGRAVARGDGAVAAHTALAAWGSIEVLGPFSRGERLLAAARGACTDPALAAALDRTWGISLQMLQRLADALPKLEATLAFARATGDQRGEGVALGQLGSAKRELGRGAEAEAHYREALDLLRGVGAAGPAATVLGRLANVLREQDRLPEAEAAYLQAAAEHRAVGNQRGEANVLGNLGALHSDAGHLEQALGYFDQALALHRATGARRDQGVFLANRGAALVQLGRYAEARTSLDEALSLHRATGARGSEGVALGVLGTLLSMQGHPDEARASYQAAIELHRKTGGRRNEAIALLNLGTLLAERGLGAEARATLQQALDLAVALKSARLEGAALAARGELELGEKRLPEAETALSRAVELLRGAGDQLELGKALARQARLRVARADRAGAEAALAEAEAILGALQLPAETDGARQLAQTRAVVAAAVG